MLRASPVGLLDVTHSLCKMMPCLWRSVRPALTLRTGVFTCSVRGKSLSNHRHTTSVVPACHLVTHPMNEPMEPLTSPQGARDFIYSLHPAERTCLLRELHRFESMAVVQGEPCERGVNISTSETGAEPESRLYHLWLNCWSRGCCRPSSLQ